jgi:hypothetical protein
MTYAYSMSSDELLSNVNRAKGVIVEGLQTEGFLTRAQADDIHTNYSVILESRSWLPPFLADWLGMDKEGMTLRLVRAIDRKEKKK